jgi:hypothetical protein
LKIPKRSSEDTKEVIRRYQRGHQKIPKRSSEDTKEVIRRYQRGHQKLWFEEGQTKQWTKDTKEVIRNWFEEGQKKKHNRTNNDRQTTTLKITYRSSRTPIKPSDPNGKQYLLHQFYCTRFTNPVIIHERGMDKRNISVVINDTDMS